MSNAIPICSFSNPQVCWDACRNTIHNRSLIQFDHISWNPMEKNPRKNPPSPPLWSRSPATASDAPAPAPLHWCAPQGAASPGGWAAQLGLKHRNGYQTDIICDFNKETWKLSGKNIQEDMLWYSLIWYSYLKKWRFTTNCQIFGSRMLVEKVAACCVSLFGLVVFGVLVHNSIIMFTKQIRIYPISWARIHRL